MNVDSLIKGAEYRKDEVNDETAPIDIISKSTCVQSNVGENFINILGYDSWMGDEFSKMITANSQKLQIYEGPRNLFLGMKGPQQVAKHDKQKFLYSNILTDNISYSTFYTMMAHKVFAVLDILLSKDKSAKENLADKLFKNNFELIDVQV